MSSMSIDISMSSIICLTLENQSLLTDRICCAWSILESSVSFYLCSIYWRKLIVNIYIWYLAGVWLRSRYNRCSGTWIPVFNCIIFLIWSSSILSSYLISFSFMCVIASVPYRTLFLTKEFKKITAHSKVYLPRGLIRFVICFFLPICLFFFCKTVFIFFHQLII